MSRRTPARQLTNLHSTPNDMINELNGLRVQQIIQRIEQINNEHHINLPINRSNRFKRRNIQTLINYYNERDSESETLYNNAINDLFSIQSQPIIKHLQIPHLPKTNKKPIRYVDTDEYKRREDNKFFKSLDKNKFINSVDDKHSVDDIDVNNKEKRISKYKEQIHDSFIKWSRNRDVVNELMKPLNTSPTNWCIKFDGLNDECKRMLFPLLKSFWKENIETLSAKDKYKIGYKVNGQWHYRQLTPEVYNKLMENFDEKHFIFDLDDIPPEYFYEKGSEELPYWSLFSELSFTTFKDIKHNKDNGGSFFKYLVKDNCPRIITDYLKRLQIFDSLVDEIKSKNNKKRYEQRDELNDCCFIYALKQTGKYDESTLNQMRLRIQNRYLSQGSIESLCQEFKIHIKLTSIDESRNINKKKSVCNKGQSTGEKKSYIGIKDAEPNRTHAFNIYENHYFIEEETPFSTYYIKHISEMSENDYDKEIQNNRIKSARFMIKSSNLVCELMKQGFFKPITFGQYSVLKTIFFNDIDKDDSNINLEYDKEYCTQLICQNKGKDKEQDKTKKVQSEPSYWFCDFEADVSGKVHKPYFCNLQSLDGSLCKDFKGERCNVDLLEYLPDNSVIYFHNLAYDIRMIASFGIYKSIIKGSKTMKADIKYKGKDLKFKDSLPIITCKLSDFPKMFNIPNIQKEIFPYKYYTVDRLNKGGIGVINEAGMNEDNEWTEDDYELFRSNIDKIEGCRVNEECFDMWKYCSFYCRQDVTILRLGFIEFRKGFMKDFDIDPFKFISISSLANEVFNQKVYYPNGKLYKLGGHVRKFCSKAIYGGRCMTAYNKKWHVTVPLCDFDAVSLYPSAMARLYTVEGIPNVINDDQLNMEFLSTQAAYVVDIEITKINKHYPFPLIIRKVNGLNLNDDCLEEGKTIKMRVDNITLEDLINFQKIEFKLIRGYYWNGRRDYRIQEVIRNIFNKRAMYKEQNNNLQQIYKLIMNSCYGKTIERPVDKDFKYFHEGDKLDKFWLKNYNKIIDDVKIADSDIHAIKMLKPIDKHFNFSLFGIQVLSMSKRIMNEVMCLAFDIGCHIYYQDTDSMHIECNDLPKLIDAFKDKYNRELIGSDLGQFHSDFPTINGHKEVPKAVESIFLMKKMYVDKLQDSTGEIDYMIRGKGLTQKSINYAGKSFDGDVMKLYKYIYDGNTQTFDLTKGQPCFSMNSNMTVSTLHKFERKIKTLYEEGIREEYFNYNHDETNQINTQGDFYSELDPFIVEMIKEIEKNNIESTNSCKRSEQHSDSTNDGHSSSTDKVMPDYSVDELRMRPKYYNHDENSPLYQQFYQKFFRTYNYQKHGTKLGDEVTDKFLYKQTGMVLKVNEVSKFAVIDVDINKSLSRNERNTIRRTLIDKLSNDDILVESGSGGLHIYCHNDIDNLRKNANIACYKTTNYAIDYITSINPSKTAYIMLPNSLNQNGRYKFIRGDYKSIIKRNASEILKDLDITLDLDMNDVLSNKTNSNFIPHIENDYYVPEEEEDDVTYLSDEEEMLLINGLDFNCEIHHYARKIDSGELSLLPLFCAINCLSQTNREIAYDKILSNPHLTCKAQMNFHSIKSNCFDNRSNINVLRKIIKLYNPSYYQSYLLKQ